MIEVVEGVRAGTKTVGQRWPSLPPTGRARPHRHGRLQAQSRAVVRPALRRGAPLPVFATRQADHGQPSCPPAPQMPRALLRRGLRRAAEGQRRVGPAQSPLARDLPVPPSLAGDDAKALTLPTAFGCIPSLGYLSGFHWGRTEPDGLMPNLTDAIVMQASSTHARGICPSIWSSSQQSNNEPQLG